MPPVHSLCVFCGHADGQDPRHRDAAAALGQALADAGIELIYGGGHAGMMGSLARAALERGGRVVGIIPECLMTPQVASLDLTERVIVPTFAARKHLMMERAEAFCVLPGGFGTMDEAFEILTRKQLGLLSKPVLFVNVAGHFKAWRLLVETIVGEGFAPSGAHGLYAMVETVEEVLPALARASAARARASERQNASQHLRPKV